MAHQNVLKKAGLKDTSGFSFQIYTFIIKCVINAWPQQRFQRCIRDISLGEMTE